MLLWSTDIDSRGEKNESSSVGTYALTKDNSPWGARSSFDGTSVDPPLEVTKKSSPFSYDCQYFPEDAWLAPLSSRSSSDVDDDYMPLAQKKKKITRMTKVTKAKTKAKPSKMKSKSKSKDRKPRPSPRKPRSRSQKCQKCPTSPPPSQPFTQFVAPDDVWVGGSHADSIERIKSPLSSMSDLDNLDRLTPVGDITLDNLYQFEASSEYPPYHALLAPPRKTSQQFRAEILDAVSRMRLICSELVLKSPHLSEINFLGAQAEQRIFRKAAELEFERLILTLDAPICDFRNALKSAFASFLDEIPPEEEWVRCVLIDMEDERVRKDYEDVIQDIKHWVDRIVLKDACLAVSYYEGMEMGRTRNEMQPYCVSLLESAYGSIHSVKKLSVELELSVMNELWAIK